MKNLMDSIKDLVDSLVDRFWKWLAIKLLTRVQSTIDDNSVHAAVTRQSHTLITLMTKDYSDWDWKKVTLPVIVRPLRLENYLKTAIVDFSNLYLVMQKILQEPNSYKYICKYCANVAPAPVRFFIRLLTRSLSYNVQLSETGLNLLKYHLTTTTHQKALKALKYSDMVGLLLRAEYLHALSANTTKKSPAKKFLDNYISLDEFSELDKNYLKLETFPTIVFVLNQLPIEASSKAITNKIETHRLMFDGNDIEIGENNEQEKAPDVQ